jgi:hypothetical protein
VKLADSMLKYALTCSLVLGLVGTPQMVLAQTSTPSNQEEPAKAASQPASGNETDASQQASPQTQSSPAEQKPLPDSPGEVTSQTASPQPGRAQNPDATEHPLGTAAAQIGNASGTTASKPAGVAIAPAKTHRSRSLLIKVGAVVGAAVALGTVMALSNSSPSRPPGATGASQPSR